MDVDALLEQLERDMKETGRGAFRPAEVPGLVRAAIEKVMAKPDGCSEPSCPYKDHFPIKPPEKQPRPPVFTNAVAGGTPRRGVRMPSGDRRGRE
jgi:hypothetical protein